jgi:hypothetical protein
VDRTTLIFGAQSELSTGPGNPHHPIQTFQDGTPAGSALAWTGTLSGGTPDGTGICSAWTSTAGSATAGLANSIPSWTQDALTLPSGIQACNQPSHLYCFEQ